MFDFEKLEIYNHLRQLNKNVFTTVLSLQTLDPYLHDQLKRAMLSALLNLSEGTGRMSKSDKKRYYTTARSSLFECVSILHVLQDLGQLSDEKYDELYQGFETGSKMLLGMIRSMTKDD